MTIDASDLARCIDHTLLRPETTPEQIDRLCDDALQYGFWAVCVGPTYVKRARQRLDTQGSSSSAGHHPAIVSVAGFPLGASATATKADEARRAIDDGATEIDMVAHLGALIAGDRITVRNDIETVVGVVHQRARARLLKVILETAALTTEQIVLGCRCCREGGADFVKTSTGFHSAGGATVEHVRLLRHSASPVRVKAAGGIRTVEAARSMLEAGAVRLGTSSSVAILEELTRPLP
jgi:deoxyribose-phosphate aldolase